MVALNCVPAERNVATIRVESVEVRVNASGEHIVLVPKALIIAAGAGTKQLLGSLAAKSSTIAATKRDRVMQQIHKIKYRKTHMICIRAPQSVLPATSTLIIPYGLMIVAHVNRDHEEVRHDTDDYITWYVTPADPDLTTYEDIPDNALAEVNRTFIAQGFNNLLKVYPALRREAEQPESPLRIAVYTGYLQGIGDQTLLPICEQVEAISNVIVALPSGFIGAWINTQNALAMLRSQVRASSSPPLLSGAGQGVRVGSVTELTDKVSWMSWREFVQTYPGINE